MSTFFEKNNDVFENASIMLEVCRVAFESNGLHDDARQLKGLEATCVSTAYASLMALRNIGPGCDETAAAWEYAVQALEETQNIIQSSDSLPLVS